jgi:hypothetical protein
MGEHLVVSSIGGRDVSLALSGLMSGASNISCNCFNLVNDAFNVHSVSISNRTPGRSIGVPSPSVEFAQTQHHLFS